MQLATGATRLRGMIRAGAAGRARLARKEAALSRMAVTLAAFCDEEMQKICGPDMAI
jgi:hypothetical protein